MFDTVDSLIRLRRPGDPIKHGLWIWAQPQREGACDAQGAPAVTVETPTTNTNTQAPSRGATVLKKRPRPKYERCHHAALLYAASRRSPPRTREPDAPPRLRLPRRSPRTRLISLVTTRIRDSAFGCARREAL